MPEIWGQLMAGDSLGFSYTGGGRETLSGAVGRRDSLVPVGQKSPCTLQEFSVARGSGSWSVQHPPPLPKGLSPAMMGPKRLTLPPLSLPGGTLGRTWPWGCRARKGARCLSETRPPLLSPSWRCSLMSRCRLAALICLHISAPTGANHPLCSCKSAEQNPSCCITRVG